MDALEHARRELTARKEAERGMAMKLHYNIYTFLLMMGINEEHTRVTDSIPTEGNMFQKGIDALYWLGVK